MTKASESVAVLRPIISVERYDGSDVAAFTEALGVLADGGALLLPAGARAWAQNGAALFSPAGNTVIAGDGPASVVTDTEASVGGTSTLFTMAEADFTLRDFAIDVAKSSSGGVPTVIFASPGFDDFALSGMRIDGGTVLVAGTQDRSVQVVKASASVDTEGVVFDRVEATGCARMYTRDNSNTRNHKRIKSKFGVYKNFWRTVFTVNAPNGSVEDVLSFGDTFDTHAGTVNGDSGLAGNNNANGHIGVIGGRVVGDHISGVYGSLWHIEENTDGAAA